MNKVKLYDINYDSNNSMVCFEVVSIDEEIVDVRIIVTTGIYTFDFTSSFFDFDKVTLDSVSNIGDHHFTEPDFWITTLSIMNDTVTFYINIDNGALHNNMYTESGVAVRLNVSTLEFIRLFRSISELFNE